MSDGRSILKSIDIEDPQLSDDPKRALLAAKVQAYFDEQVAPHIRDTVRACSAELRREADPAPGQQRWSFVVTPMPLYGGIFRELPYSLFDGLLPVLREMVGGDVEYVPGVEAD